MPKKMASERAQPGDQLDVHNLSDAHVPYVMYILSADDPSAHWDELVRLELGSVAQRQP